jgi:hypothetical protein
MWISGGFFIAVCAKFKWKSTMIAPLKLTTPPKDVDDETPRLITELHLEMGLTGEVPPKDKQKFVKNPTINKNHLTDEAFRPKFFNVRVEDGYFALPGEVDYPSSRLAHQKDWTKRLVFDNTPFPLESEWQEDAHCFVHNPEGRNYWDIKDFVAYSSTSNQVPSSF